MTDFSGFEEMADKLEELADTFDTIQSQRGTDLDARGAIQDGISNALDDQIVPEAKGRAEQHVPSEDAQTIDHESGEWSAGRYRHFFFATSDLVRYHEFGTGARASDPNKGTVNAVSATGQPGYIIRPNGDYPLGIPASKWNGPSDMVDDETGKVHLEFVVHPGVHGKHFMMQTLEDNEQEVRGFILAQINKLFREHDLL